jgi:histidyl-tRNA synthetase
VMARSIGAQLSYANSIHASFAVLVGKNEVEEGEVTLRNLESGEQEKLGVGECVERIKACFEGEK